MKKFILVLGIILSTLLYIGCNNQSNNPPSQELNIADYFPIQQNIQYSYEGVGNEFAFYTTTIDYTSENRIQQRINNGGTETVEVIECKDNTISVIYLKPDTFYRENFLDKNNNQAEILLMAPLTVGTTWTLNDSSIRTITGILVDVETPAGNYSAIEVTTSNGDEQILQYYVKDIGLVKSIYLSGTDEISSSLSSIQDNISLTQKINFYYPNINDSKIYFKNEDIQFKTNDVTKDILTQAYKESIGNDTGKVFSENTIINSLYLNDDENAVHIDLNGAFLTEMNAGSEYESMILQSIANTFGQYYSCNKVILTIDNQLYSSGHILLQDGEYLTPDFNNVVQIY